MNITLDDFGLNKKANHEIYKWTQNKKVDFVSILANSSSTNEALMLCKKDKKRQYQLGLHFNLIEGKPLCNKNEVLSLVDNKGYFYSLPIFMMKLFLRKIKKEDILKELQKQYDVVKKSGIQCNHINSHQNIHIFHFIYTLIEEFANKNKIPHIRQLNTIQNRLRNFPIKYIAFMFLYSISSLLFPSNKYRSNSFFETTFHPGTNYD
ncbi:MAG: ChbG/HpnK family deacetylase [Candidatus Roizmanbacteria bacterium]|nr:ChbG/HpnK family deacetylase [Candidatus Roizmanbacteria bacterium]